MNWLDQSTWTNFWSEQQKHFLQPFAKGLPLPAMQPDTAAMQDGMEKLNDLVKRSMESWATLFQPGAPNSAVGGAPAGMPAFDAATLSRLIDPAEWSKALASGIDTSLERLTEGPVYATPTDIDRKVRKAQQLWLARAKAIEGYRQQLQAGWMRAFERMLKALNDPGGAPLKSPRDVINLWLDVANEELLEMHHHPDFLEAQRKMTRAAAEYRLAEQELAEIFCALHHIPTRTEVDEAHKAIVELRREVRALRRQLAAGGGK